MSKLPVVSIIIPCFNYGHYLSRTLESALANRGDGWKLDIIVVDDGSTDNTPEVAKNFGSAIRYIFQENAGLSAARNRGLQEAAGDYVIFLDADDLLGEKTVEMHLAHFQSDPALDVSVGMCKNIEEETQKEYFWPIKSSWLDMHICNSNVAPIHSFMFKKGVIEAAGSFDTSLKACEDYDFLLRIMEKGYNFQVTPEVTVVYNRHDDSLTSKRTQQIELDAIVRRRIGHMLRDIPDFPSGGNKYAGWLAYAMGCLSTAVATSSDLPALCSENLETGGRAIMEAAALYKTRPVNDKDLLLAETFYAGSCYNTLSQIELENFPFLKKPFAFLSSRYRNFQDKKPEHLRSWLNNEYKKMLCKRD